MMRVKIYSGINELRKAEIAGTLKDMCKERDMPYAHIQELLKEFEDITLEVDIDLTEDYSPELHGGTYVARTLDALPYSTYDEEAMTMTLEDGRILLFPLYIELPDNVKLQDPEKPIVVIYEDDIPKYEKLKRDLAERGHVAAKDTIIKAIKEGRVSIEDVRERIKDVLRIEKKKSID